MIDRMIEQSRLLKSKNSILAYQYIFKNGVILERQLYQLLGVDISRMKAIAKELVSKNLIRVRVDEKGNNYYLLNKKNYNFKRCDKCGRFVKKLIDAQLNLEKYLCKRKKCKYHYILENINAIDAVIKVTDGVILNTVTKNKEGEKSISEWGCKEFAKYIKKKYRLSFPGLKFPYPIMSIMNRINELCILMKRMVGSKEYILYCKQHIDYIFKKIRNSDDFNISKFLNIEDIQKTIDMRSRNEGHKNIAKANYCSKYKLECVYCKGGICTLEQDGINCSERIREHMKNKYGV